MTKVSSEAISAIISKEMQVKGEIQFKGKARIDGTIEGNITGEYLILSETSKVHGDMNLDSLICHGSVEGNIQAKTVTVQSSANISGKIVASSLTVESGASIDGEIISSNKQKIKTIDQPTKVPVLGKV